MARQIEFEFESRGTFVAGLWRMDKSVERLCCMRGVMIRDSSHCSTKLIVLKTAKVQVPSALL